MMVRIDDRLSIPDGELQFEFSTAGGPGGQHVNRTETRVTLRFDVAASSTLSAAQKARVAERLATRIDGRGVLRVRCGRHRSRARNRDEAIERFAALLAAALRPRRKRKRTKVSRAAKRRRLEAKRRRAAIKRTRRGPSEGEG